MTASFAVPAGVVENLRRAFGHERAGAWAAQLPALIEALARRWQLSVGPPFDGLSFNWVAPCRTADGMEAVLKIGIPEPSHGNEAAALAAYGGRGAVRLLAADPGRGALLMERVVPGTMLTEVEDDVAATSVAAGVMRAIRTPPPNSGPAVTISDWARAFASHRRRFGGPGPVPEALLAFAEETYRDFAAAPTGAVLLHGDLHHYNILRGASGWVAIDPKGVVGEPEYETGAFIRNPLGLMDNPGARALVLRRTAQLADELGYDRQRAAAWAAAQCVLSVVWSLQGDDWKATRWLAIAEWLLARR